MSTVQTLAVLLPLPAVGAAVGAIGAMGAMRLLRRAQRIFHRMPVTLVGIEPGRVLVVAPHMDDEVIGPGGTIVRHVRAGSEVGVVFASDGAGITSGQDRIEYIATRKAEAQRAAESMGTTVLGFLDHPDGELCRRESELAVDLAGIVEQFGPDHIFVPFPTDHHRDHQATAAATAQAIRRISWRGQVWSYEAWSPLWPNVSVDITDVLAEKVAALECHASQTSAQAYVEATIGLNHFRGLRVGSPAAEAFFRAPAAEFRHVCARLTNRI